ncbi:MAG TPA: helix-turn-helix domain-containing protein, partial [Verrucomicrobiales bacterium]|nr:helix-turn-helix domain-containing protein [Verrucomicrobiales bacterium]
MNVLLTLLARVLRLVGVLLGPGGFRAVIAENLLLRQQLLVLNQGRKRAPNISPVHRLFFGFWCLFIKRERIQRLAVVLRPSTFFRIHAALVRKKYRDLFSVKPKQKPGPKGPDVEVIQAILEFKKRNPRCGCPRIAEQISATFGIEIGREMVRRMLSKYFQPTATDDGPSCLSFLGHSKDSLWSLDLFLTESISLKSHWVLVVMDQFSRRIIGFAVQPIAVDGPALCRMFNNAIAGSGIPKRLSYDNDPLFKYFQWKANLRILDIESVRTVPYVPISHPFIERKIGSIRREYLDHVFYWNGADLERKLDEFKRNFNGDRVHAGIRGITPNKRAEVSETTIA